MQQASSVEGEFGFLFKRKSAFYNRPEPGHPDSWFEKNKIAALRLMVLSSDDLRLHRVLAAQQLSEAWSDEFLVNEGSRGANSLDQLMHIVWLQHWSAFLGLLSVLELETIKYLSENGRRPEVLQYFHSLAKKRIEVIPNSVSGRIASEMAADGSLIGMFHGSFDPPQWVHLAIANYYRQLCDVLVVGADSNDLLKLRKGEDRPRLEFQKRYNVLASFPNVIDMVAEVPTEIIQNGKYSSKAVSDFYQAFGVGIVFFDGNEPHRDWRIEQITRAGAKPFDISPFKEKVFSSTDLIRMRDQNEVPMIRGDF